LEEAKAAMGISSKQGRGNRWRAFAVLLCSLLVPPVASALDPGEVRDFEDVFVISGTAPDRSQVQVSWDIAPGYYLYNNRFLQFSVATPGVEIGPPQVPRGEVSFDELLGEQVEKYHNRLTVTLPLLTVAPNISGLRLQVRSQGCLENELCYPPTEQVLLVGLPAAAAEAPADGGTDGGSELAQPAAAERHAAIDELLGVASDEPLAGQEPALPADSAFVYEAIGLSAQTALVRFTAQPGYYLYRDKFAFRVADASGFAVREVSLPDGVIKDDPEFGNVPVIYGQVEIPVRLSRPAGPATTISLQADFQGCRDGDICYPPQSRVVSFEMPPAATAIAQPAAAAAPLSEQDRLAGLLTRHSGKAMLAFFIAGVLLAFTPCVFPMVPILSGIIMGQGERLTTRRALWLSSVYVLAMALTYTAAGVLAGLFGHNLQALFQSPVVLGAFALIFVLLALSMFGLFELQLPAALQTRLATASNRWQGGQWLAVAVMGFLSALIVGPCVAPPLMAALIVIGASGDAWLGGLALFALSLGMGVPLILFGVSAGRWLPRAGAWMNAVKAVFGVGLLALAIWLLERILPGAVIMLLWGILAIGCAVYLGALEPLAAGCPGWRRAWKSLGLVLLLAGMLELLGAAAGGDDWLDPLRSLRSPAGAGAAHEQAVFRRIKSQQDLDTAISQANAQGKFVMLDFYADWCVECLRMQRNTFQAAEVVSRLESFQALQADVTANDATDQALLQAQGIIGPPAILFFDRQGREMKAWRLVGYFSPAEFAAHLDSVLAAP
jgi:thiol:disulfide interchange protein DsbD